MLIKGKLAPGTPELSLRDISATQSPHSQEFVLGYYTSGDIADSYTGRKDIFSNSNKLLTRSSSSIFSSSNQNESPRTLEAKQEAPFVFCVSPFFRRVTLTAELGELFTFYSQGEMRGFCVGGEHPQARDEGTIGQAPQVNAVQQPLIWINGKDVVHGSKIDLDRILKCGKPTADLKSCKAESLQKHFEIESLTNIELRAFGDQTKKNRVMSSILK